MLRYIFLRFAAVNRLWLFLVLLSVAHQAVSQASSNTNVVYSTSLVDHARFTDPNNAVGGSDDVLNQAATTTLPVLSLLPRSIRLRMAEQVPANSHTGFVVSINTVLNLSVLQNMTVTTYNAGSNTVLQTIPGSALVGLAALTNGKSRVEFITTTAFTDIELNLGSLLSLNTPNNVFSVFYAYGLRANNSNTQHNGATSNGSNDVVSSLAQAGPVSICVNTGVTNPANAVDADGTNNFAVVRSPVAVNCPVFLNVKLTSTVGPRNYRAGFVVGSSGLTDLDVLTGTTILTYLETATGTRLQESASAAELVQVHVLANGLSQISFLTSKPFNRVELRRNSVLAALSSLNVYYGFGISQSAFRDLNPVRSSFPTATVANIRTLVGNTVCLDVSTGVNSCASVSNPLRTVDSDTTNFASLSPTLATVGRTRVRMNLNGSGRAGNRAGVVLNTASGLLSTSLLQDLVISTYATGDATTPLETSAGGSLLGVNLLSSGRQAVTFLTTRNFKWVEIDIPTVADVNLFSATRIYYAFAEDQRIGFPTALLNPANPLLSWRLSVPSRRATQ